MQTVVASVPSHGPWFVRQDRARIRRLLDCLRHSEYASLLSNRRPKAGALCERRGYGRLCVRLPIQVTPVAFDGERADLLDTSLRAMPALTRDLTVRGVGFAHHQLLCGDYAAMECRLANYGPVTLLLGLRWSNVRDRGLYLSGGRFEALLATEKGS